MAACEAGRRVRYVTTAALVNELVEAAGERVLSRTVARYDLLCLDELGYLHLDSRGAELLFQVLTEREEKASVAAASNAPFSEWGQTFTDPRPSSEHLVPPNSEGPLNGLGPRHNDRQLRQGELQPLSDLKVALVHGLVVVRPPAWPLPDVGVLSPDGTGLLSDLNGTDLDDSG